MVEVAFAIPGDIATPTGGYIYDREVLRRLPGLGLAVRHLELPAGYPSPSPADLAETARLFSALHSATLLLIDGLALGAMPASLVRGLRQRIVALVHHPLGCEAGLAEAEARRLVDVERTALRHVVRVIVPSHAIARLLATEFGVPAAAIAVAEPGTARAPRAHGTGDPLEILAVGAVSPRKGYDVLIEALAPLASARWRLTIAGALDRHPDATSRLAESIRRHAMGERVRLCGALRQDELAGLYAAADLFVLASLFEGYGMVLAEAMARGLPIVCTTGGAAAETVPDGAALKVEPGRARPLEGALRRALGDADLRRRLGEASWQAGQRLPGWDDTARIVAATLREAAR